MKLSATFNYRLQKTALFFAWALAAALIGWLLALVAAVWGERYRTRLAPWVPFSLGAVRSDAAPASQPASGGAARLVGLAGPQALFSVQGSGSAARSLALRAGDSLPSGERLLRVERDAVVLLGNGVETRVELRPAKAANAANAANAAAATTASAAQSLAACRLAAADRAVAIFVEPAVAKALTAERATLSRIFEPLAGSGGIRARGTGGTTAMFAILDGDVLVSADGNPMRSGDAIVTDVLARIEAGGSVVVEGSRSGAPRRWVYAARRCAV